MLISSTFKTPFGWLNVKHDEHYIYQSLFTKTKGDPIDHPLSMLVAEELTSYLKNPHHRFQLPLKPTGSVYQLKVWNALLVIPVGRTITYGELAGSLQSSPRAVGQACKRNPLALFIPCHRVVGKHNHGGYMGNPSALSYKLDLLQHENANIYQHSSASF
ncbi:methylated-DNA--[protein]-cysteine S-methyltransferase [Legionella israelensis]|nr:methylated-DNA--[protein]-cysteine S-methyltransferase [Legionella israelensis]QBR85424.1 methylated-DNA--[protein]-cysteine S-methyltransferase [Legionella israelensis]QBS11120.1 methylated-DNA--[protein]-cysteine S-methyltransferase [Legionella israelensis]